jgi:hypothetical protein
MKRIGQTLILTVFVVLTSATFVFAEYSANVVSDFPYFHLGCLIVGGLITISLKHKYNKIYLSEAIGSFALYTILVAMFTAPVVDTIKLMVS